MTKLSRKEQIIADAERRLNFKIKELKYLKMKKDMENEGLWDNIHKKRARGEKDAASPKNHVRVPITFTLRSMHPTPPTKTGRRHIVYTPRWEKVHNQ